jgi:hypothetical protein
MENSLQQQISPNHSCWANWVTKDDCPQACQYGMCSHLQVKVNFEDITRNVSQPPVRRALVAAEMWCALQDVQPVAIIIRDVNNHPGQKYEIFIFFLIPLLKFVLLGWHTFILRLKKKLSQHIVRLLIRPEKVGLPIQPGSVDLDPGCSSLFLGENKQVLSV